MLYPEAGLCYSPDTRATNRSCRALNEAGGGLTEYPAWMRAWATCPPTQLDAPVTNTTVALHGVKTARGPSAPEPTTGSSARALFAGSSPGVGCRVKTRFRCRRLT